MTMSPEIKDRWLAALRSGDYEQGYVALRRGCLFSGLGVLCEIANQDGVTAPVAQEVGVSNPVFSYSNAVYVLPGGVRHWARLNLGNMRELVKMDGDGKTFEEIADYIEENL
jgi:hypothetical protein